MSAKPYSLRVLKDSDGLSLGQIAERVGLPRSTVQRIVNALLAERKQKLEELVIQGMCGLIPNTDNAAESAGVLMIPITDAGILKRVEGLTAALQTEFIRDIEIHINPGYELIPLPEGASYLGFIFAQAPRFEQTLAALKSAHAKLRFVTQPKWELENLAV